MSTPVFFSHIQGDMREVEALMRRQGEDCHPELRAALEHLLAAGGKRIRPTLGLLTGRMLGAPHQRLITLVAAVELLHTATLVHDDLIDGALLRRGIQTLNARWSPPATVLTGDFVFARAASLAAQTDHLPLMRLFSDTLAVIVNGELTQLFAARGDANRDHYYERIHAKTASLIEMATRAAAMISPVEETVVIALQQFGFHIGMAFQIVDDVLDFTGDQDQVGKPVGNDLLQGLVTLPTLYFVEQNPQDARVRSLLDGRYLFESDAMLSLVEAVRASGATEKALGEANEHIQKAVQQLENLPDGIERQGLLELANYTITRKN